MSPARDDVESVIAGVSDGSMDDAAVVAWLREVFEHGLSPEQTVRLTRSMLRSGTRLRWPPEWADRVVDKHSTGGVGDKVSLPLAPALAACGAFCPMIAGRSLAHTGGTLDKLESMPGYEVDLDPARALRQVEEVGCMIAGQSDEMVPADRRLYAIRDVTGLIASVPLICGSILSKKLAEGLAALVIDLKVGRAAFMTELPQARELAAGLRATGAALGLPTRVLLTEMDAPLGRCSGNSLEVLETFDTLRGEGPPDLVELIERLGGELLAATGIASDRPHGAAALRASLEDGRALERFVAMCAAQGVSPAIFESRDRLEEALGLRESTLRQTVFEAPRTGRVEGLDALALGKLVLELGGGRRQLGEPIDRGVGFVLESERGVGIEAGQPWLRVWHRGELSAPQRAVVAGAIEIREGAAPGPAPARVLEDASA